MKGKKSSVTNQGYYARGRRPASRLGWDGSVHSRREDDARMILEDVDQSSLRMLVVNDEEEIVVIGQVVRIASAFQILKGGSAGF